MLFEFKPSFDRSFKKLTYQRQEKARATIKTLLDYLDHKMPLKGGLGLKNFKGNYWEIRADIRDRIIFELSNKVVFWFIGNNDEIRRFIKTK